MPRTYALDDQPVDVVATGDGLSVTKQPEAETGIEKSMEIALVGDKPQVVIHHTLTNRGLWPMECAPWAITQLRTGGVAILPQSEEETGLLPNRSVVLWPYTDIASPQVTWSNGCILVRAEMQSPFKVGFPNSRGWLAYWLDDTLFVKRAGFDSKAAYYDFGSSSECYCGAHFIELETLAPITRLAPGQSAEHIETWELYANVDRPRDQGTVKKIVASFGLE
jgi:hypothetical protein